MIVLGLTGSLAMGKSTTAAMFAKAGIPIFAADRAVHMLYAGAAVALVEAAFPGSTAEGIVDRKRLAIQLGNDTAAWRRLESVVHPLLHAMEAEFLEAQRQAGRHLVILDHPLLLESGDPNRADINVVVSASPEIQRARAFDRPGMTETLFTAITSRQMSDAEKRSRAHFVIDTGRGLAAAERAVRDILRAVAGAASGH